MGYTYKLRVTCDRCDAVLRDDKTTGEIGGGIGGKPAETPAVLDVEGAIVEPAKPGEVVGVAAWRTVVGKAEQLLCQGCLVAGLTEDPCEVWATARVQV